MEPLSVSPKEAAKLVGLGVSGIYDAIKAGELPAFEPVINGKRVNRRLVMVEDLKQWLRDYRVGYCSKVVGDKVEDVESRSRTHEPSAERVARKKAKREANKKAWREGQKCVRDELKEQINRQRKDLSR